MEAVLRQDIAWYDTNTTSDFASKMTEDLYKIQDGMGEKMGMLVRFVTTFLGSLIYPYTQNWLISLVISSVLPLMIVFGGKDLINVFDDSDDFDDSNDYNDSTLII